MRAKRAAPVVDARRCPRRHGSSRASDCRASAGRWSRSSLRNSPRTASIRPSSKARAVAPVDAARQLQPRRGQHAVVARQPQPHLAVGGQPVERGRAQHRRPARCAASRRSRRAAAACRPPSPRRPKRVPNGIDQLAADGGDGAVLAQLERARAAGRSSSAARRKRRPPGVACTGNVGPRTCRPYQPEPPSASRRNAPSPPANGETVDAADGVGLVVDVAEVRAVAVEHAARVVEDAVRPAGRAPSRRPPCCAARRASARPSRAR